MNNIIISDLEKFEQIKDKIQKDGFDKLHIVSDFDRTLTKAFINGGERVSSLISVLRDEDYLVEGYSEKAKALFNHYHKIEIDSSIPMDEKKKAMEEWWEKHCKLLIESGLNKNDLKQVAKSERIVFRDKVSDILYKLNNNNIPFVIFSASGLGDESIAEILKTHELYFSNIEIISNKYIWDENGYAINTVKPHIHTFNKNETSVKHSDFYSKIKERKNVILLGDSLGDVGMVEGFDYNNLLKIGFLNSGVEEKIEEYKKHYDIVITNDGSMEFVYDLLKEF